MMPMSPEDAAAVRNIRKARAILHDWGWAPEKALRYLVSGNLITTPPRIIRTREELAALDPDTLLYGRYEGYDSHLNVADLQYLSGTWRPEVERALPAVVIATGDTVRAARQALEATAWH